MYFGEREGVMPFFNSVGFQLPARKGIADFLQEVTSPKDQPVRAPAMLCGGPERCQAHALRSDDWCRSQLQCA